MATQSWLFLHAATSKRIITEVIAQVNVDAVSFVIRDYNNDL